MSNTDVLIVCGVPLARLGLLFLLRTDAGLHVCGEADGAVGAMELFERHKPGIVVLDLMLAHGDGFVLIKDLHRCAPAVHIIVVTALEDLQSVQRAFRAGAQGYVTTRDDTREVLNALVTVRQGALYASPSVAYGLLTKISEGDIDIGEGGKTKTLSDREMQIFRLIGGGMGTADIARELGVSVKTVETHRQRIKEKLHLQTSSQLVQKATQWVEKGMKKKMA